MKSSNLGLFLILTGIQTTAFAWTQSYHCVPTADSKDPQAIEIVQKGGVNEKKLIQFRFTNTSEVVDSNKFTSEYNKVIDPLLDKDENGRKTKLKGNYRSYLKSRVQKNAMAFLGSVSSSYTELLMSEELYKTGKGPAAYVRSWYESSTALNSKSEQSDSTYGIYHCEAE